MSSKEAPSTRRLNKFGHASSAISRSTRETSTRLMFPDIYDSWFKGKERLKIEEIQHRKEFDRPFFHEFVLVRFNNGSHYRFDRRPDATQPIDTLRKTGSEAYDTVELVVDIESPPHARSECIAALDFKDHCVAELSLILAVCSAISRDKGARRYTLCEFNCYFFSWTIIATVARYCVAWESLPYDSNFLCLPGDKLSQTIAEGAMNELIDILPHSVPSALSIALPEMIVTNVSASVGAPPEYTHQLRASLEAESLKAKLSHILQKQRQVIVQTLRSTSNREKLQNAIENRLKEAGSPSDLDRLGLSVLLQRALWQDDVYSLSSNIHEWTAQFFRRADTEVIVAGQHTWELVSNIIITLISKDVQASASSPIAELVDSIVDDILCPSTRPPPTLVPTKSSIRNIINASVVTVTGCNVRYAVNQVKNRMEVTRKAIQDSIIHAIQNLFPDELPIGLRIPKPQNYRLRRLLWLARPESAFCLWRTPRSIQDCDSVKHRELQKYLSRRIYAHSRDVRILGVESREVEACIREAMSRVWLAGSREIEGFGLFGHHERIKLLTSVTEVCAEEEEKEEEDRED